MEILKTIPEKIIPEKVGVIHRTTAITFELDRKKAHVHLDIDGEGYKDIEIDIMPILDLATTTQQNTIKGFFKKIIAEAVEVSETELPDVFVNE